MRAGEAMSFTAAETRSCQVLIELALEEDLGEAGDLTSRLAISSDARGRAFLRTRRPGIVAGMPAAALVLARLDPTIGFRELTPDGTSVEACQDLAEIDGPLRSILAAERTVLNFAQHLSGVATLTRRYVDAVASTRARILDTRKTTPGWRLLEKYAVRCGGGANHRVGLFDAILLKDNHLAALASRGLTLQQAVASCRAGAAGVPVTIEVDSLDQVAGALDCRPDVVLLDNMSPDQLAEAVRQRDRLAPGTLLEASGSVTLQSVRDIAASGVERISVGQLTHSAPALDIGLDYAAS